jgi:hypothetical protein
MGHMGHVARGPPVFRRLGGSPAARERAPSKHQHDSYSKKFACGAKNRQNFRLGRQKSSKYSPAALEIVKIFACGGPLL